jgi:drug/metabolite transporter (DMT)-like permease
MYLALHFAAWIASLRYTSVASSVALVTMNPLLLAVAGYLIWNERLVRRQWFGIGLALLGGLCIGWNDFQQPGPSVGSAICGDVLAVCGAVMVSAYLLCGRFARVRLSLSVYVGLVYGWAALVLITGCLLFQLPLFGYETQDYIILILLALIPQVLGHTILNWALAYMSPTLVALAILGEPIGAALLAWAFLNEPVVWLQGLGAVCLLTGIVMGQKQ